MNHAPTTNDLSNLSKQGFEAFTKGLRPFTKPIDLRSSVNFDDDDDDDEEEEATDQIRRSRDGMVVRSPHEESQPSPWKWFCAQHNGNRESA